MKTQKNNNQTTSNGVTSTHRLDARPIKFRGKRVDNNEWAYGYVVVVNDRTFLFSGIILDVGDFDFIEVDPITVGQLTNLHDKKGQEIYEGDVLETNECNWIAFVVFLRGAFILIDGHGGFSTEPNWKFCEIIGNIFENRELLKGI